MVQLLFSQGSAIFSHQNAPFYSVTCWSSAAPEKLLERSLSFYS